MKDRKVKYILLRMSISGRGEGIRKGGRKVNMRSSFIFMYEHRTVRPVEIVLRGKRNKEERLRG
jgi:hypothetical protein